MTLPGPSDHGSPEECAAMIRAARHVLVICHVDPDGDAIGSLLGMGWLLQAMDKEHVLACAGVEPSKMRFLPRSRPIVTGSGAHHDLIVTVDCNSVDRLGSVYANKDLAELPIVNIDHHVTNTLFGQVNWVEPRAAATAEIGVSAGSGAGRDAVRGGGDLSVDRHRDRYVGVPDAEHDRATMAIAIEAMRAGAALNDIVSPNDRNAYVCRAEVVGARDQQSAARRRRGLGGGIAGGLAGGRLESRRAEWPGQPAAVGQRVAGGRGHDGDAGTHHRRQHAVAAGAGRVGNGGAIGRRWTSSGGWSHAAHHDG